MTRTYLLKPPLPRPRGSRARDISQITNLSSFPFCKLNPAVRSALSLKVNRLINGGVIRGYHQPPRDGLARPEPDQPYPHLTSCTRCGTRPKVKCHENCVGPTWHLIKSAVFFSVTRNTPCTLKEIEVATYRITWKRMEKAAKEW